MPSKSLTLPPEQQPEITQSDVRRFTDLVDEGVDAWTKAGKLLVQIVEKNQNAYAIILKECPKLSISLLLTFERIGRNELHPRLVLDSSIGAKNLLSLPYALQAKYYKEPLPVVVSLDRAGKPVVQNKPYHQLNKDEAKRVFSFGILRSVEEQASLLSSRNGSRGHAGRSEISKFRSIGCFRLSIDEKGSPTITKTDSASVPTVIEIKTTQEGGIGSNVFEILVDKNLVKIDAEPPPEEPGLNSAVQNQIQELIRRRSEFTAMLRSKPEKKTETEKAIKEINRKIASLESIA